MTASLVSEYPIATAVWVYSNGSYYPGVVTGHTPTCIKVDLVTGGGKQSSRSVNPSRTVSGYAAVLNGRSPSEPRPKGARQNGARVAA